VHHARARVSAAHPPTRCSPHPHPPPPTPDASSPAGAASPTCSIQPRPSTLHPAPTQSPLLPPPLSPGDDALSESPAHSSASGLRRSPGPGSPGYGQDFAPDFAYHLGGFYTSAAAKEGSPRPPSVRCARPAWRAGLVAAAAVARPCCGAPLLEACGELRSLPPAAALSAARASARPRHAGRTTWPTRQTPTARGRPALARSSPPRPPRYRTCCPPARPAATG
jgi:hypothetical protein